MYNDCNNDHIDIYQKLSSDKLIVRSSDVKGLETSMGKYESILI